MRFSLQDVRNSTQLIDILDKHSDDLIIPDSPQPHLGFTWKYQRLLSVSDPLNMLSIVQHSSISGPPPKFVLFDSQLDAFKFPISSHVEELPSHHPRQALALPLIVNYFEWIGVFEDGLRNNGVIFWVYSNPKFT